MNKSLIVNLAVFFSAAALGSLGTYLLTKVKGEKVQGTITVSDLMKENEMTVSEPEEVILVSPEPIETQPVDDIPDQVPVKKATKKKAVEKTEEV